MGQLFGPSNPAADAGWPQTTARKGFFTDTSICIGCKACEVACKEWNHVPVIATYSCSNPPTTTPVGWGRTPGGTSHS